jgi:hypothetical protein
LGFIRTGKEMSTPRIRLIGLVIIAFGVGIYIQFFNQGETNIEAELLPTRVSIEKQRQELTQRTAKAPLENSALGALDTLVHRNTMTVDQTGNDLFRPNSWAIVVQPKVEAMAPPPIPTAPPVPFKLLGKMKDIDGNELWYLLINGQPTAIQVGTTLNNTYKVDAVTKTEIVLTYLPLKERQIIAIPMGEQ